MYARYLLCQRVVLWTLTMGVFLLACSFLGSPIGTVIAFAGQMLFYWLADALLTDRAGKKRMIRSFQTKDPKRGTVEHHSEALAWGFLAFYVFFTTVMIFHYHAQHPNYVSCLGVSLLHGVVLSSLIIYSGASKTFFTSVAPGIIHNREVKKRRRDEQKRQQAKDVAKRPKSIAQQIQEAHASHQQHVLELKTLSLPDDQKRVLIELAEARFADVLHDLSQAHTQ